MLTSRKSLRTSGCSPLQACSPRAQRRHMPASFEHSMALCRDKQTGSSLMSPRSTYVSPRMLHPGLAQTLASPRPFVSAEANSWYRADQGVALPPTMHGKDAGLPWQTGSSELPYPRPMLFSGLGMPTPAAVASRRQQTFQPRWQGPKPGWATDLLPARPGAIAASLCGKGSFPIADEERKLPCWRDAAKTVQNLRPTHRRDPIHGIPVEEATALPSSMTTTMMDSFSPRGTTTHLPVY